MERPLHVRLTAALLAAALLVACGGGEIPAPEPRTEESGASLAQAAVQASQFKSTPQQNTLGGPGSRPRTVTLITGDKVTLRYDGAGRPDVQVQPGQGRERMVFLTSTAPGDVVVMPAAEAPLVASGRLDRDLFNVSKLVQYGYDDERRADLPLIVTYSDGVAPALLARKLAAAPADAGVTLVHELRSIGALAVRQRKSSAAGFLAPLSAPSATGTFGAQAGAGTAIRKIWLDRALVPVLATSVPQIGAPAAWQAGLTGEGVTVAVLDTGVDRTHPDLATQVIDEKNFTDEDTPADLNGHGTYVASIVAGTGAASGGQRRGVAPGARLLSGKVCTQDASCPSSNVMAALEWAVLEKQAQVVNLSLGYTDTPELDPLEDLVNRLSAGHGTLIVAGAGNQGTEASVLTPSSADAALSVGAVDADDELAPFSSRGPRVGDGAIKPDITGPGRFIWAARAKDSQYGDPGEAYFMAGGTSVSAPHVAGAAAILLQRHPQWRGEQLKAVLMAAARPNPNLGVFEQGAGRVDVAQALVQTLSTSPPSLSLGDVVIRPENPGNIQRSIIYRNTGSTTLRLQLRAEVVTPLDEPVLESVFTVTPSVVEVPAGGLATATLTASLGADLPEGWYKGRIVAVQRVVRRQMVTFRHTHADGTPVQASMEALTRLYRPGETDGLQIFGSGQVALVPGRYLMESLILKPRPDGRLDIAYLVNPSMNVVEDMTIDVDARVARPVVMPPPRPDAVPLGGDIAMKYLPHSPEMVMSLTGGINGVTTAHLGPTLPDQDLKVWVTAHWVQAEPGTLRSGKSLSRSPYVYSGAWEQQGRYPTGLNLAIPAREVATVHLQHALSAPGQVALSTTQRIDNAAQPPFRSALLHVLQGDVPFRKTAYYYGKGARWAESATQIDAVTAATQSALQSHAAQAYEAGKSYVQTWNQAPFAPALVEGLTTMARRGDQLVLAPALFSDQAGHAGATTEQQLATYSARLFRNGEPVFKTGDPAESVVSVPAGAATYRFETVATRDAIGFSTHMEAAWTFRSVPVDAGTMQDLPVLMLRFEPRLDAYNRAAPGPFLLPVSVQGQAGLPAPHVRKLAVQVSYDDGKTWASAPVHPTGGNRWAVRLRHPHGATHVSLRGTAADRSGSQVDLTVVRAYALGCCAGEALLPPVTTPL